MYEVDPAERIPEDVALEFANLVGVMAVLPYLREAVHRITDQVFGSRVLVPMIRAGELRFTDNEKVDDQT